MKTFVRAILSKMNHNITYELHVFCRLLLLFCLKMVYFFISIRLLCMNPSIRFSAFCKAMMISKNTGRICSKIILAPIPIIDRFWVQNRRYALPGSFDI